MTTELKELGVGVKMYVDRERWDWMGQLIPGYPCVLTNLLYVQNESEFCYLESTNETQIFAGDAAFSSRFISPIESSRTEQVRGV